MIGKSTPVMRSLATSLGVLLAASALLSACGRKSEVSAPQTFNDAAVRVNLTRPSPPDPKLPGQTDGAPLLAYSYSFAILAPSGEIASLQKRQEAACSAAGSRVCQVLATSLGGVKGSFATAHLELRASRAWIEAFRAGLPSTVRSSNGQIISTEVTAEDLTHAIVDTEAAVATKIALRDKLKSMINSKAAKLSDLIELEAKLSQIQGEIDQQSAELSVNQERVALSKVEINYNSAGADSLALSLDRVGSNLIASLAFIVDALSLGLPVLLLLGVVAFLLLRFRKRVLARRRKAE